MRVGKRHWGDMRHLSAARLVRRRFPLFTVRDLLGHSTITLSERYAFLSPENLDDDAVVLDRGAQACLSLASSGQLALW